MVELFRTKPALFVENRGQWADHSVRFVHRGSGVNVAMTEAGPVLQVFNRSRLDFENSQSNVEAFEADAGASDSNNKEMGESPCRNGLPSRYSRGGLRDLHFRHEQLSSVGSQTQMRQFSVSFPGANIVTPIGLEQSPAQFNYCLGEQSRWRSEVPSYERVAYCDLYDGIDLHAWGLSSHLKYEFHVAPGADYRQIRIQYDDSIAGLSLNDAGELVVDLGDGWGQLRDNAPLVYQEINGERVPVAGRFVLLSDRMYTFEITSEYDSAEALIIDPELVWSTYFGGSDYDDIRDVALDPAGNILVAGFTYSTGWISGGFDTTYGGRQDAFIAKLNPAGEPVWSTYLGGELREGARGLTVDTGGNVFVVGTIASSDSSWPSDWEICGGYDELLNTNGQEGATDGFLIKLSPTGQHLWSTYVGGYANDNCSSVALDSAGNVLVAGVTQSPEWVSGGFDTTHGGNEDGFVVKISPNGEHLWSTYLGGHKWNSCSGVAIDSQDNVLLAGTTSSPGWVTGGFDTSLGVGENGYYEDSGYVVKLSPAGQHLWSTYLGGDDDDDNAIGIIADGEDNVLVTGRTASSGWISGGFDTTYGGWHDTFVASSCCMGCVFAVAEAGRAVLPRRLVA